MNTDPKEKKILDLKNAIASITKSFGDGSIMRLGNAKAVSGIEAVSTGSISVDCALGIGGLPKGRIVEIFGPESSGKTTLVLHTIASVQKAGGQGAFIDVEHALDPAYAKALGVDLDNLLVSQPDSGEQALTICEILVKSGAVDIIVIDSVAALVPQAELDGDMGMATMGMQARLMSQALRKLTGVLHKTNCMCIFTNQMREKVGVMFGNPETTPGGKALKFYASVRLDIRRKDAIKDAKGSAVGNHVKVKVVKNKVAPPFTEAEFDIRFGTGIDKLGDILETAVAEGIVEKKGSWMQYKGELIGQGKDASCQALNDKAPLQAELVKAIYAKRLKQVVVVEQGEPPEMTDEALKEEEFKESLALVEAGLHLGLITKNGAWLEFGGKTIGHGKEDAKKQLVEKPELRSALNEAVNQRGQPELPLVETVETPAIISAATADVEVAA